MSRYDAYAEERGEYEPNSLNQVLRNKQGIINPVDAARIETELLTVAYVDSFELPISLKFTSAIIRELHRKWLGDFYYMAGEYRTVNVSKGGFMFCPAPNILAEMERLEREQLAEHTPCLGSGNIPFGLEFPSEGPDKTALSKSQPTTVGEVAYRVSVVHAELQLIHPFREGNGRLGRWLADLMVLQAGYPAPEYDLDNDQKRNAYYSALRRGFAGDFKPLTSLFEYWIERAQQLDAESQLPSP